MSLNDINISPEVKSWVLEQSAVHAPNILWDTMINSGWDRLLSANTIEIVLGVELIKKEPLVIAKDMPFINLIDMPTYLNAGDKLVSVLAVVKNPHVVVLGDVLSSEECDQLVAFAQPKMKRSKTVDTKTGGEEVNDVRTSSGMFFGRKENNIVALLEKRIANLINWPEEKGEGLQILQYKPGAEYKPHYDYFDPNYSSTATIIKRGGQRLGTFIIYLKEPTKGGGTIFPDINFEVLPKKGNAVFFSYPVAAESSLTLHGGSPIVEGEKWIATKWLRESNFN